MTITDAIQLSGDLGIFFALMALCVVLIIGATVAYERCRSELLREEILLDILGFGFILTAAVWAWVSQSHGWAVR